MLFKYWVCTYTYIYTCTYMLYIPLDVITKYQYIFAALRSLSVRSFVSLQTISQTCESKMAIKNYGSSGKTWPLVTRCPSWNNSKAGQTQIKTFFPFLPWKANCALEMSSFSCRKCRCIGGSWMRIYHVSSTHLSTYSSTLGHKFCAQKRFSVDHVWMPECK